MKRKSFALGCAVLLTSCVPDYDLGERDASTSTSTGGDTSSDNGSATSTSASGTATANESTTGGAGESVSSVSLDPIELLCITLCANAEDCGVQPTDPQCVEYCATDLQAVSSEDPECGEILAEYFGCLGTIPCDDFTWGCAVEEHAWTTGCNTAPACAPYITKAEVQSDDSCFVESRVDCDTAMEHRWFDCDMGTCFCYDGIGEDEKPVSMCEGPSFCEDLGDAQEAVDLPMESLVVEAFAFSCCGWDVDGDPK